MNDHPGWVLRVSDALSEPPMVVPWMRRSLALLLALPMVGTVGYSLIEKWSVFDSLYMSIITITTIGFGEVRPQARRARASARRMKRASAAGAAEVGLAMAGESSVCVYYTFHARCVVRSAQS